MKTNVYIDAGNLYYGLLRDDQSAKWLDPLALARTLIRKDHVLGSVKFYTARVRTYPYDAKAIERQRIYLRALSEISGLEIVEGYYNRNKVWMPAVSSECRNCNEATNGRVHVVKLEEKRTDVNIATDMLYDVFTGEKSIDDVIVSTEELGDILPSNIDLSTVELEFRSEGRECLLRNELKKIAGNYDYIIIDTPPALNVLTMNAYAASGGLIIPMAPEILSVLAVSQIRDTIVSIKENFNPGLEVLGILLNRFSMRLRLNREVDDMAQKLAKNLGTKVFRTKIHSSVSVAAAPAYAESIITYDPGSKPAKDFKALVKELMNG